MFFFFFRTDSNGKFYELNLSLYEDIDETNYLDVAKGLEIVIKLTKLSKGRQNSITSIN